MSSSAKPRLAISGTRTFLCWPTWLNGNWLGCGEDDWNKMVWQSNVIMLFSKIWDFWWSQKFNITDSWLMRWTTKVRKAPPGCFGRHNDYDWSKRGLGARLQFTETKLDSHLKLRTCLIWHRSSQRRKETLFRTYRRKGPFGSYQDFDHQNLKSRNISEVLSAWPGGTISSPSKLLNSSGCHLPAAFLGLWEPGLSFRQGCVDNNRLVLQQAPLPGCATMGHSWPFKCLHVTVSQIQ